MLYRWLLFMERKHMAFFPYNPCVFTNFPVYNRIAESESMEINIISINLLVSSIKCLCMCAKRRIFPNKNKKTIIKTENFPEKFKFSKKHFLLL